MNFKSFSERFGPKKQKQLKSMSRADQDAFMRLAMRLHRAGFDWYVADGDICFGVRPVGHKRASARGGRLWGNEKDKNKNTLTLNSVNQRLASLPATMRTKLEDVALGEVESGRRLRFSLQVADELLRDDALVQRIAELSGVSKTFGSWSISPTSRKPPHEKTPSLKFPDKEHRDKVEAAAMAHVTVHYWFEDLEVEDVSKKNLGYDLVVHDYEGNDVHLIEVKGTSSVKEGFYLSSNEYRCAQREENWLLAVVANALKGPTLKVYTANEMEQTFTSEPIHWRYDTKS